MVDLSGIADQVKTKGLKKVCDGFAAVLEAAKTTAGNDFENNDTYKAALETYNKQVAEAGCSADKLQMGFTMLLVLFTIWKMMMK